LISTSTTRINETFLTYLSEVNNNFTESINKSLASIINDFHDKFSSVLTPQILIEQLAAISKNLSLTRRRTKNIFMKLTEGFKSNENNFNIFPKIEFFEQQTSNNLNFLSHFQRKIITTHIKFIQALILPSQKVHLTHHSEP
jgi:hypothetical protein